MTPGGSNSGMPNACLRPSAEGAKKILLSILYHFGIMSVYFVLQSLSVDKKTYIQQRWVYKMLIYNALDVNILSQKPLWHTQVMSDVGFVVAITGILFFSRKKIVE